MPRAVAIPASTVIEDISNIHDFPGELIRFQVGKGIEKDGIFEFIVPQNFELFEIKDSLYQDFAAKFPSGYSNDDLWDYVDMIRSGANDTRPSPNYDYDREANAWVPNVDKAKVAAKAAIEKERIKLSNLPITYLDITIDGDEVAKSNINGKLAEIAAAEFLPGQETNLIIKVWRDVNNVTHEWPTLDHYKAWLSSIVVALSQRTTNLYLAAWGHKANIDALDTVPSIEAYDISGGWD